MYYWKEILILFGVYIGYSFYKYLYKIIHFDTSEYNLLLNQYKINKKKVILAVYGHTSIFDIPYFIWLRIKFNFGKILVKKKYKWLYPFFFHKFLIFIENKASQLIFDDFFGLYIEGSRSKKNYIHSGFKYIAQNNNAYIVFTIINFKKNKLEFSHLLNNNLSNQEFCNQLKLFLKDKHSTEYALYPKYCSIIAIKE